MDSQGRWHEVDALVLGQGRLHLVELKYYIGSLAGTESTWLRNGRRSERSPLLLARQKAQRLSGRRRRAERSGPQVEHPDRRGNGWVPWIQECVFLHHPDLDVQLSGIARSNLFSLDPANNTLPDVMDRLLEPAGPKQMTDQIGTRLAGPLGKLGILRRPTREFGSWLITDRPLAEGEGWQDFPAEHRQDPEYQVRIRIFPLPQGSGHHQLAEYRRRVHQEHQLLKVLKHDGIVTPPRDWTWSGRIHQTTSSLTRMSKPALPDLDGAELYEAPEGRWSPDADRQKLDGRPAAGIASVRRADPPDPTGR